MCKCKSQEHVNSQLCGRSQVVGIRASGNSPLWLAKRACSSVHVKRLSVKVKGVKCQRFQKKAQHNALRHDTTLSHHHCHQPNPSAVVTCYFSMCFRKKRSTTTTSGGNKNTMTTQTRTRTGFKKQKKKRQSLHSQFTKKKRLQSCSVAGWLTGERKK